MENIKQIIKEELKNRYKEFIYKKLRDELSADYDKYINTCFFYGYEDTVLAKIENGYLFYYSNLYDKYIEEYYIPQDEFEELIKNVCHNITNMEIKSANYGI